MSLHTAGKCALIVAHPGHELRVHGWLEAVQPTVYVLTDGSGRASQSRLASTTRLLRQAGARPGAIYGRCSDRALYAAVLRREAELFCNLAEELAAELVREQFDFVLADAAEGTILAHDLCRGLVDAAVTVAQIQSGSPLASFSFNLDSDPSETAPLSGPSPLVHRLDAAALTRKLAAARSYPELRHEINESLATFGESAFGTESFFPAGAARNTSSTQPCVYERHGETLVAQGVYPAVLRYRDHVSPILTALQNLTKAA